MLCSQNRHANTTSRGEWQRPGLAPRAMWPKQPAQTVMRAAGLQQALGAQRVRKAVVQTDNSNSLSFGSFFFKNLKVLVRLLAAQSQRNVS